MSVPSTVRTDYKKIIKNGFQIIDVRTPSEYQLGSTPHAVNLPILDDEQRKEVGVCYKNKGQTAAIALGHRLVKGETKEARIKAWINANNNNTSICCWRGGLRSRIAQGWLEETGLNIPRISGGYKALRHTCIEVLGECPEKDFVVVAGRTGSGKTEIIKDLTHSIDLEGMANHRGSAFGSHKTPQPSAASFENSLATAFLQIDGPGPIALEDESRTIGHLAIPLILFERMRISPIVVLEIGIAERIENIYQEYIINDNNPNNLLSGLDRIKKRLGGKLHSELKDCMREAFDNNNADTHRRWIHNLLSNYYDPMYDYQIRQKNPRIVMQGDKKDVLSFVSTYRVDNEI